MRVILVAVSLIVAVAGRSGHAEGFFPVAPPASVSSDGPQEAGATGPEEKATGWLNLTRGTRVRLMVRTDARGDRPAAPLGCLHGDR